LIALAASNLNLQGANMKNVLLLIHKDPGQEARLQVALDLVRALDGHLTCLDVVGIPAETGYPGFEGLVLMVEQDEKTEARHRAHIEERLSHEDVPWTMGKAEGGIASCLKQAAGLADIIVLNARLDHDDVDMPGIANSLLLKAKRPLLIVPQACNRFSAAGPAMVAWDGSKPAMAALAAAVPLLKLANSVRILEVQGSSQGSVREAASYLSRYDIHAEVDLVACFRDAPHETSGVIQDMCEKEGCSYLVMGAYGHSPLREKFFGGVTRRMFESARVPVFMAH
jgi:nucleotide-binding universal stress UspA family protein